MNVRTVAMLGAVLCSVAATSADSQDGKFRAGSAVVYITPSASAIGPTDSIRDPLSVKAIVIRNNATCAALVGIDVVGLQWEIAQNAIVAASLVIGCPRENFLTSATHTHSGGVGSPRGPHAGSPDIQAAILKAVGDANNRLQPARIGFATTQVDLNINRDLFAGNRWTQGPNPESPSDKTLAVLALIGEDALPIDVYINYAMHPINFYKSGVVSTDFAGDASR